MILHSSLIIILDKEKSKYNWKFYQFFFDKKILVDFTTFLLEFIDDGESIMSKDPASLLLKIESIALSNDIITTKKNKNSRGEDKKFNFLLDGEIKGKERKILSKLITSYFGSVLYDYKSLNKADNTIKENIYLITKYKFAM